MTIIAERDCKNADEFLDLLSPRGDLFGSQEAIRSNPEQRDAWYYRGHSDDAQYKLVPTALRNEPNFEMLAEGSSTKNEKQIEKEIRVLEQFFNLADASGLSLPEDSQAL
jgi:hypothetical protein